MKIAIDARMYGPAQCSGIGAYIQKLTEQLFEIDKENEYILFMAEPEFSKFNPPTSRPACWQAGVKKIKITPRWYSYAEQFILPFQFNKEKLDLIHYPHFNSPILFNKKSICTIHDITPLFFPGHKMGSIIRRLGYKTVFWFTLHKAKKIIAVSESTKQDIIKYFKIKPEKINVIYNGVDEYFRTIINRDIIKEEESKKAIKQKHNNLNKFGITKPYIFFISVWRSHKNIEGLIKAFNILKEKYKIEHQLVLAGREDLHYTNIRAEINRSTFKSDVISLGYVEKNDLPMLYNAADLFVIPSFIEGFGLTAIEAQACGCPVVSTDTTSMPEILKDSALFFNPNNHEQMADAIYQVLNNPNLKQSLVNKGLENAKRFSWKKCAAETLKIYNEIIFG